MIIDGTPPDDKTEKGDQKEFLELIRESDYLTEVFETTVYYLNGGNINLPQHIDPQLCVITSGGNIITIIANILRLAIYDKNILYKNLRFLNIELDIETLILEIYRLDEDESFISYIIDLSDKNPSDLDFKNMPLNPLNDFDNGINVNNEEFQRLDKDSIRYFSW